MGSRVKKNVVDPATNQLYVFKKPAKDREAQIWSELLASYIAGDLLGWPVQHVSIARMNGEYGNLMRHVFNPGEEFVEGFRYCAQKDTDYDIKVGTHHTLPLLMSLVGPDGVLDVPANDYRAFWAQTLAFDALISNTDRHAENWAVIKSGGVQRMAPLYDNAASMGCEFDAAGLAKWFNNKGVFDATRLKRFMDRGTHHVRLKEPARKGSRFEDVADAFLAAHPEHRGVFQMVEALDLAPLTEILNQIEQITDLPAAYRLTNPRSIFISKILKSGLERIKNIVVRSKP